MVGRLENAASGEPRLLTEVTARPRTAHDQCVTGPYLAPNPGMKPWIAV